MADIKSNLFRARSKWENIGLELKIDAETLKCIKSHNKECHDACLHDMLMHRLEAVGSLTWSLLCKCLRSPLVERNDVASEIEKKFAIGDYHSQ